MTQKTAKKTSKKRTSKKDDHSRKDSHNVIVNVNSASGSSSKKTSRRGVQSFSKGLSYLGGSSARGNFPMVINNLPSPMMPMFPQVDVNRVSALENSMNNIHADIQGLYGRLNRPTPDEVSRATPVLDAQTQAVMSQVSSNRRLSDTLASRVSGHASTSTNSTPSFGGSSSSSGGSGGGDLPIQSDTTMMTAQSSLPQASAMQSVQSFGTMPIIQEESSNVDNESNASNSPLTPVSALTTQLSRLRVSRVNDTEVQIPSSSVGTTINLNPSSKGKSKVKPKSEETTPISSASDSSVNQFSSTPKKNEYAKLKKKYNDAKATNDSEKMTSVEGNIQNLYKSVFPRARGGNINNMMKKLNKQLNA